MIFCKMVPGVAKVTQTNREALEGQQQHVVRRQTSQACVNKAEYGMGLCTRPRSHLLSTLPLYCAVRTTCPAPGITGTHRGSEE